VNQSRAGAQTTSGEIPDVRWIVAQEGSRQSYAVPLAFHRLGALKLFYADIWMRQGRSWLKRGPGGARALAGRYLAEIPEERVVSFNLPAVIAKTREHFVRGWQAQRAKGAYFCNFGKWFATRVRDHLSGERLDPSVDAFFGFDTNSLEVLEMLKERGVLTVLDQVDPGVVEEEMVIEEAQRWPGWERIPGRLPDHYRERREAEWRLADLVLVNSEWSRDALVQQGVAAEKIVVVPLAIDLRHDHEAEPVEAKGRLKVLWLGSLILRKGIQYLIDAARLLQDRDIEFILAGPLGISHKVIEVLPENMKVLGRVTRDQLGAVYRQAHVFVLPTISDGFAITQLEAMAHGLPVVITPNCGRVVTDGLDGLVVPARNGKALADALARLESDRELVREMSRNALRTVRRYDLPSNARMIGEIAARHRSKFGGAQKRQELARS